MFSGPRLLPGLSFCISNSVNLSRFTFILYLTKKPYLCKKYSTRSLTVLISQDDSSDPLMHSR